MKQLDFEKETVQAKMKMLEGDLRLPMAFNYQNKNMSYSDLRRASKSWILEQMRKYKMAFINFEDPKVPELSEVTSELSDKEIYFVLRSVFLEKKQREQQIEIDKIKAELESMKTKKERKRELEEQLASYLG